jgi:glycosyltransferase involved in cell wall biosynthesis
MKVAIVSVQTPYMRGGAELQAETLKEELNDRKITAEIITIPFKWYPPDVLENHIKIAQLMDISEANGEKIHKLICLKFPAYYCQHPNKTLWLLHQHRQAYDLYDTPYGEVKTSRSEEIVNKIRKLDNKLIPEHKNIYAISNNIANRLKNFNDISTTEVLYPPPKNINRFRCDSYNEFIIYPSRFSTIKRQELIIKAMQWIPSKFKLVLLGDHRNIYGLAMEKLIEELNLKDRVLLTGLISEQEKIDLYANCLAVYNGPYEEDYGYVTIEAFLSSKPIIVHTDSGGPLEFVTHHENGFVVPPLPEAIAQALLEIISNKNKAISYGENGKKILKQKNICWDYIIEKLLS